MARLSLPDIQHRKDADMNSKDKDNTFNPEKGHDGLANRYKYVCCWNTFNLSRTARIR